MSPSVEGWDSFPQHADPWTALSTANRCTWQEPGTTQRVTRCGDPGAIRSAYGSVRCKRHSPKDPEPNTWSRVDG